MKKRNKGGRALFTSAVLLLLVIAAAWALKARSEANAAAEAAAQQAAEEAAQAEQEAQEAAEAQQAAEEAAEAQAEQEAAEQAAEEQAASDETARAEQEKASFTTDYESAPLLNTTPIKYLSLNVGATEDEIRLNWMSPSASAGQVSWYTVQNGELQTVTAECAASATMPGYYVNKATVTGLQPGMTYA